MVGLAIVNATIPAEQPFVPVITGGDLGSYSLAREFHEAYGVISAVVPTAHNLVVGGSSITQLFPAGPMFDAATVLKHLASVAQQLRGPRNRPLVLITGFDYLVRISVEYRQELLDMGYVFVDNTVQQLDNAALKENFYELCDQLGVPYPRTAVFDADSTAQTPEAFAQQLTEDGMQYPVILKAGDGGAWGEAKYEGRRKVHYFHGPDELIDVIHKAMGAGYAKTLIIQEFVPGNDSQLRILHHFRDRNGNITLTGLSEVIVEDHAANMEGSSRAVIVRPDEAVEHYGRLLMDALNWHGFGMFDIKIHAETGEPYFLEMNPRLGRHHYYLTAAGANPATYLVDELIEDTPRTQHTVVDGPAASLTIPLAVAQRYATTDQKSQLEAAKAAGTLTRPLMYAKDKRPLRMAYQLYQLTKASAHVAHTPGQMN
ncbi:carboxylate--amine ligase [Yaniella flava]|uniref:Carboxylate--amine ligase n=1 Tax=Yaniella flava TaxID=287930 RepID=A0ABN2UBE3_9MICC